MTPYGDDRMIFLALKFSIQGFFWVGTFGSVFLCSFLGIQNNLKIRGSGRLVLRIKYNQTCFWNFL